MTKIRVFVSSVQKELELERAAVAALFSTDPFLLAHCEPVLFERQVPSPRPEKQAYLRVLQGCQAYLLMIAREYGRADGDISATHHEYRQAQALKRPTLVLLKGAEDGGRTEQARALIDEIKRDGYTYKRFDDREDLKPLVLKMLYGLLEQAFGLKPTEGEVSAAELLIDAASPFESAVVAEAAVASLDQSLLDDFDRRAFAGAAEGVAPEAGQALHARGLAVRDPERHVLVATAAAVLLFAPRPANRFPQCELLADAYDDVRPGGRPKGQLTINAPIPQALEQALKFIDDHTLHPRRVVGLNSVRLDEYPTAALREALVNAVAHRSYEDRSRKIFLRLFRDRVEVASPGYPPKPLTLAKLRRGTYRPCSRNPLIAQTLALLAVMEQRGSGFARMREAMLNHGLNEPQIQEQDGFFVVTLPGPDGDHDRIKVSSDAPGPVTPALEAQLNDRQKKIMERVLVAGAVTRGWCVAEFGVANDTAGRDLKGLTALGLLESQGSGRGAHYVLRTTENRPAKP